MNDPGVHSAAHGLCQSLTGSRGARRRLKRSPKVVRGLLERRHLQSVLSLSVRIASHNCRDLWFSMSSHAAGGRICLTNCFISHNIRDVAAL